jgi:aspartyl protease family protein
LVLAGSALLTRRIPLAQGMRMMIGWVLIFAAAYVVFTFREDFRSLGHRIMLDARGGVEETRGGEVHIRKAADGHFWVTAAINGHDLRFLVDSGATTTSISRDSAATAGLPPDTGFGVLVQTANGVVLAHRARARSLELGTIRRSDFPVLVSPGDDDVNVLGMNFLSSLASWSVEGQTLILRS